MQSFWDPEIPGNKSYLPGRRVLTHQRIPVSNSTINTKVIKRRFAMKKSEILCKLFIID
jgi:hypothetical protein